MDPTPAPHQMVVELGEVIDGEARFDEVSRMLYRTDASIYEIEPVGLVLPRSAADVSATVRIAAKYGVAVLPRGGGTSLAGQVVGEAVHLDLSKHMNRILEFDREARWVRVEPGVVLDELNEFLKPHGLQFAPDPATSSRANIGGMVGNNSSGSRSILYGKTIDHVLGLKVVLADGVTTELGPMDADQLRRKEAQNDLEGRVYREVSRISSVYRDEIERRFPKVMRRVSGYNLDEFIEPARPFDLTNIVVGSEGTLCVVVEAKLNLEPLPARTAVVACHFQDLIEAMHANRDILETSPSAVELLDKILLDQTKGSIEYARHRSFLVGDPEALLFVEYQGDSEVELLDRMDHLEAMLRERGRGYAYVKAIDALEQKKIWDLRKAGLGLLMGMKGDAKPNPGIEDTCVPPEHLAEYVERVRAIAAESGVVAEYYGHASVGVLHIRPILDLKSSDGIRILRTLEDRISDVVLEYGGSMSAEHGDGLARSEWIPKMFGTTIVRAFAEVKGAFDPDGIMNPGKIVDAPPMDGSLRYGDGYRPQEPKTHFSFAADGGMHRAAEMCSGVGECRKKLAGTMCPSYMATLDEQHTTRGRANALRAALSGRLSGEGLTGKGLYEVMDLCLECKACKSECPSNVDMAKLKYEFLAHYHGEHGYPLRSHLFGKIGRFSAVASGLAPVTNWLLGLGPNRWLMDRLFGISRHRRLPRFAGQRFSRWFAGRGLKPSGTRGKVLLFNDTFTEFNEPQIGMAATFILERLGFEVEIAANRVCCGRPLISKGFLAEAKQQARANIEILAPFAREGIPILGLEPSCILCFADDYLDLIDHPDAARVAEQAMMLEDFVVQVIREGTELSFTQRRKQILVHGHCHQKALVGMAATVEVLNLPFGYEAAEINSGCCGMAGSFGYETEHYEISMKVGEQRLFRAIREADEEVEVAAVGTSCRHQIADATGRRARHWAEILVEAL